MKSILVFRTGSLGDTLVSLPALWAIRHHFRGAKITLLSDQHAGKDYVLAADILRGSGAVDEFLTYPADRSGWGLLWRPLELPRMMARLRRASFDAMVYLASSARRHRTVRRDCLLFRAAGIKTIHGMEGPFGYPPRVAGRALPRLPREADHLLALLNRTGIATPPPGQGCMDLGLGDAEQAQVKAWLETLAGDGGRPWVAVGPGSKMPAKIWPRERYADVVAAIIGRFDVWPVIFGGPGDRAVGQWLLERWGRGYNAAGSLGLRASAAAIGRCRLYVGNDTGTMHMAAAAGVRCVAVFSSRDHPGVWEPYGPGHRVFRTAIDCEGCGLWKCTRRKMECVMRTGVQEVTSACLEALGEMIGGRP